MLVLSAHTRTQDVVTTDFCYDFLQFSPDGIMLRLPGGISIEMTKYWDGQPVRFVCCERLQKSERTPERAWGRILWCVVIEPAEGDEDGVAEVVEERGEVERHRHLLPLRRMIRTL